MSKIIVKDLAGPASSSNKIYIASGSELDIAGSSGTINLAVDAADITSGTLSYGRFADDSILFIQESVIAADATVASDPGAGWADATGVTITVPAADANECSKLIVQMDMNVRINKDTHAFGGARIGRTAPSTASGNTNYFGVVSGGTEVYDCVPIMYVDESLSNADHTYKLEYSGLATGYTSTMYPRYGQTTIRVIGVK
jgi:hypothetical protein